MHFHVVEESVMHDEVVGQGQSCRFHWMSFAIVVLGNIYIMKVGYSAFGVGSDKIRAAGRQRWNVVFVCSAVVGRGGGGVGLGRGCDKAGKGASLQHVGNKS